MLRTPSRSGRRKPVRYKDWLQWKRKKLTQKMNRNPQRMIRANLLIQVSPLTPPRSHSRTKHYEMVWQSFNVSCEWSKHHSRAHALKKNIVRKTACPKNQIPWQVHWIISPSVTRLSQFYLVIRLTKKERVGWQSSEVIKAIISK